MQRTGKRSALKQQKWKMVSFDRMVIELNYLKLFKPFRKKIFQKFPFELRKKKKKDIKLILENQLFADSLELGVSVFF